MNLSFIGMVLKKKKKTEIMYFLGEKMECMKDYKIIYGHNNILMRKILFFKVRKHYTFK